LFLEKPDGLGLENETNKKEDTVLWYTDATMALEPGNPEKSFEVIDESEFHTELVAAENPNLTTGLNEK
jgi:hypothetical protein